jgi:hypothetical protein
MRDPALGGTRDAEITVFDPEAPFGSSSWPRADPKGDPSLTKNDENLVGVQVSLKNIWEAFTEKNMLAYFFHKRLSICPNLK